MTHYGGFRTLDGEWCIISYDLLEPGTWVSIRRKKDGGAWSTHRVGERICTKGKTHYYRVLIPKRLIDRMSDR